MKKINEEKILEEIKKNKEIIKKKSVKKIGLFGSFAKNQHTSKSDIDILVEFDEPTFNNYTSVLHFLEKMLKRKIDLVIESDLKPELDYVKKQAKYVKI